MQRGRKPQESGRYTGFSTSFFEIAAIVQLDDDHEVNVKFRNPLGQTRWSNLMLELQTQPPPFHRSEHILIHLVVA